MSEASEPIVLRPLTVTWVAFVVTGIVFGGIGLVFVLGPLSIELSENGIGSDFSFLYGLPIALPLVLLGGCLAIRGPRMRVILTDNQATIRNIFATHVIPRKLVTGMGIKSTMYGLPYPGIEWRDPRLKNRRRGKKTRITVVVFMSSAAARTRLQDAVDEMTYQLSDWCDPKHAGQFRAMVEKIESDDAHKS